MTVELSVVIPTRGEEAYLDLLLSALQHEATTTPMEVIVVDDPRKPSSSAQAFREMGAEFDGNGSRLRYVEQSTPGGKAGALNQGAQDASSETLMFMDADVLPEPRLIEEALRLSHECDVVSVLRRHTKLGWSILGEWLIRPLSFVTPWCCLMARSDLAKYGWWRNDYVEDVEFWLRARNQGCVVRFPERRVILRRRVREEYRKSVHALKHLMGTLHTRP